MSRLNLPVIVLSYEKDKEPQKSYSQNPLPTIVSFLQLLHLHQLIHNSAF